MAIGHKVAAALAAKEQEAGQEPDMADTNTTAPRQPVARAANKSDEIEELHIRTMAMKAGDPDETAELRAQLTALQAQMQAMLAMAPTMGGMDLLAQRSAPRNNPNFNRRSVFTYPEGELVRPKPKLSRETFFCTAKQRDDQLTPFEIELFNQFTTSRTARNGTWTAEITRNGSHEQLHITVPFRTTDERMSLLPLTQILMELLGGAEAADPAKLAERVAELEKKLAAANG